MSAMESDDLFLNRFNFDERHRLIDNARSLRSELIKSAFQIFQEFQIEDLHSRESAKLGNYTLWLTADSYEMPSVDDEPQESMAFAVIAADKTESLRFHIPVDEDFDRDDLDAVEQMKEPLLIALERRVYTPASGVGRTTLRVALDAEHLYFYRTMGDTQIDEELYGTDKVLEDELNRGFDSQIGLVASFNEDLINWQVVKQRQIMRHPDGSVDTQDI